MPHRRFVLALLALIVALPPALAGQQRLPGSDRDGPAFTFNRIVEGVYHAVGTGSMAVGANAAIVINADDVLIVDSHVSPAAANALLEELKQITDKPVRYVVNTHFHFDHAHGNQIYPASVEVIGHEFTRAMLSSGASMGGRIRPRVIGSLPGQIAALRAQLDTTNAAAERATLERRIRIQQAYRAATDAVRPTPPTITLDRRLTLHRGGREIRIEFFGRGHTGGDVVVHLPAERVLITGDLVGTGTPYMGDGYLPDWVETLEQLQGLEFDVILPGHGPAFRERERIGFLQEYLTDLWVQIVALHAAGVSAEEAARRVDLRGHTHHYPTIRTLGVDTDAALAAYEVITGAR